MYHSDLIHHDPCAAVDTYAESGVRCLAVCQTKPMAKADLPEGQADKKWEYIGVITFMDPPREDTAETIAKAKELNIKVKMITGDQLKIGKKMVRTVAPPRPRQLQLLFARTLASSA